MKILVDNIPSPWNQEEYKKIIDKLIADKNINKLKLQEPFLWVWVARVLKLFFVQKSIAKPREKI